MLLFMFKLKFPLNSYEITITTGITKLEMVIIGKIFNERLTLHTLNLEYYVQEFTSYFKKQAGQQTK